MFNSFSSALSALKAHSTAVDTVGNNLANVNTTGFKASDVAFKDIVAETVGGSRSESGMGVSRPMSIRNFAQGAIQSSSGALDVALQGRGFFVVNNGNETLYTRDGSFQVDSTGYVVTLTGERVQQYVPGSGLKDIRVPTIATAAIPTANVSLTANLDGGSVAGDTSKFAAPIEVVDSLGVRHVVTITFTKESNGNWAFSATVPGPDTDATVTDPVEVGSGSIAFDQNGKMDLTATTETVVPITIDTFANGAAPLTMNFNLLDSNGAPLITQFGQPSAVSETNQDGFASAQLISVGMEDGGKVVARYANGQQSEVAHLAVALFANPDTLIGSGNNSFRVSFDTAQPSFGYADTGGRGKIKAASLEGSTVDIAREFTNLIIYQRGYQANSRVITTADELSQEVLNLKR